MGNGKFAPLPTIRIPSALVGQARRLVIDNASGLPRPISFVFVKALHHRPPLTTSFFRTWVVIPFLLVGTISLFLRHCPLFRHREPYTSQLSNYFFSISENTF
jgi:hypothetical protein